MTDVLPVIIDPEISENNEEEQKSLSMEINDEEVFSEEEEEPLPEVKPKVRIDN